MIKKLSIAFVCFCTSVVSFAQNNDYFNLKDVKTFRFDHLELNTEKEVEQFLRNPGEFNFIEALKVNTISRLDQIVSGSGICGFIKELDLSNYQGDINAATFTGCGGLEILHLSVSEEKLEQLRHIRTIGNLQTLYLYIRGKPENLSQLSALPQLKELHIIGEFLPADLSALTGYIQEQTTMQVLGLSVDRITDLPPGVLRFKTLSKLNLYDNLSVFTNNGISELNEEKLSILFNLYTDAISAIGISYFSNNGKLADFETAFLQTLYKGEIIPQQFESDERENELTHISPFKKEFQPDFKLTSEFRLPYPRLFPPSEIFTINPADNAVIYSNSGLKISIASNSFVNQNGEDITDPVYLKLTQMNQATDLLFAGLNLKNGDRQFCNQFLFNLSATTERSSAHLKAGYQIRVVMPVSADSAITYFFDYESNTWQDLNFYNQIFANSFTPLDFYKIESNAKNAAYYQFDTTSFSERFTGKHHYLLNDRDNNSQLLFKSGKFYADLDRSWNKDFNKDGKRKGIKVKRGKSYVKLQKVIPKVRNKERQYFKVLDKTEQGLLAELSAFRKINFNVLTDPENKKAFNDDYVKHARYFDVIVHYGRGKTYCEITLKTAEGFKKLQANITDTDDKKLMKKQLIRFAKAYKAYQRLRARREQEFNAMNRIRFEEFKVFSNDRIKALQKDNKSAEIKIHQLGSFGLLYDRSPVFSTNVIAQYTDESGLPVDVKELFMIDNRYNTFFRIEVGNIAFDPATCAYIIACDYSGNLYFANKSDVAASNLSNNSLTYIKLKKVNPGVSSILMFNQLIRN